MPILEGDIQLLESQVMTDADNGGGAATGVVVADGGSNNLFPDVSELDHVYGRVQLRKVFVGINTTDTDTYLGANVIIAKPPGNPDVSAVLFSTDDDFDRRTSAASRVESYLAAGPSFAGYLFGDHIAGQMTVTLQQRVTVQPPVSGETLLLVALPGSPSEVRQYVRVTDVSTTARTFTTSSNGNDVSFTRNVVVLTISDALASDFPGFDALYSDATVVYTGKTKVLETIVADAARYYGVVPLSSAASFGDFAVAGEGIYAQLVPSSRTEVAVPDARANAATTVVLSTGQIVTLTVSRAFTTAAPLFAGGGITPGTLSVKNAANATLTDKGGTLIDSGATVVGTVDYGSGIISLSTNALGTGTDNKTVQYVQASNVATVTESMGLPVTVLTRRLTWVETFDPIPTPGSITISYMAQGVWYTLSDDGSGAIRGSDPSFGAASLNSSTGTLSITLGALPDAPSQIIVQWASGAAPTTANVTTGPSSASKAVIEIDIGQQIGVGSLSITWGGHTVTDSSGSGTVGALTGYGTGTVDHSAGIVLLSPTTLPAPGTVLSVTTSASATDTAVKIASFTDSGANWTGSVGSAVVPGSFLGTLFANYLVREYPHADVAQQTVMVVKDNGDGGLFVSTLKTNGEQSISVVGTVDYSTGDVSIAKSFSVTTSQGVWTAAPFGGTTTKFTTFEDRSVTAFAQNGSTTDPTQNALVATIGATSTAGTTLSVTLSVLQVRAALPQVIDKITQLPVTNGTLASASFFLGGSQYQTKADFTITKDSALSGSGTAAGSWVASTGILALTAWPTGVASDVSQFSAGVNPATSGSGTVLSTDRVTFRTASAPVASGGFTVRGTLVGGSTAFSVTANSDGTIHDTHVFGVIDYNTGVVDLTFGTATADPVSDAVKDVSAYGIPGVTNVTLTTVQMASLLYDAVTYSYLPLEADLLGLDPVRLPSDGRVPIFKKGGVAVVHYTHALAPASHTNGDTVDLGETRLSVVTVVGNDGLRITDGYTPNFDAGHVVIDDVTGWSQPVTIGFRIEDMALMTDAQISGAITLSRPLSHDYPLGSFVSSAYLVGDMQASVERLFEQQSWTSVWQSTPIGGAILAAYDQVNHPPVVTNAGAVTESWALIFTSTNAFSIVGEHLGVVGVGSTSTDCSPLNPNSGTPYFTLTSTGFGLGWAVGNVIRLDTIGALAPLWLARVVQQGDNVLDEDSFTVLVRGDVNA